MKKAYEFFYIFNVYTVCVLNCVERNQLKPLLVSNSKCKGHLTGLAHFTLARQGQCIPRNVTVNLNSKKKHFACVRDLPDIESQVRNTSNVVVGRRSLQIQVTDAPHRLTVVVLVSMYNSDSYAHLAAKTEIFSQIFTYIC